MLRTEDAGRWTPDVGRRTMDAGPSTPYYKLTGELKKLAVNVLTQFTALLAYSVVNNM